MEAADTVTSDKKKRQIDSGEFISEGAVQAAVDLEGS